MNRTTWLQDRRMQKFRDVLSRWERGELSMMEAGELLGMSERQFRRYRDRYEEDGLEGLLDRRLGKPSPKRVPARDAQLMLELYGGAYRGWNVKHFHEHLVRDHGFRWGYTWVKTQLHTAGLVERAKRRGAHRRKRERKPCEGMMLHQDGSRAAWLAGEPALDLIVTMDDATSTIYSAFLVEEEGTASTLSGAAGGVHRAGPAVEPLYRSRQPLLLHAEGRRGGRQGPAHPGRPGARSARHRAHPGLFAGGARALGAHVRHAAGPPAEGAEAGRHQRHRRRPTASSARSICRPTMPASPSRRRSPRAPSSPADPAGLAEILCVEEERSWRATTPWLTAGSSCNCRKARCAPITSRPASGCTSIPDGTLAVFHGPRLLARYDAAGKDRRRQTDLKAAA